MLAEKIRQAVIEESQKNMFTLKDLRKSYKKVLVFDKLDDLVKYLQDVAQENINNFEKNVKRLPMHKEIMESLLYEEKQNGGVLDVLGKDKVHSKYLVAVSDISEPEKHFYLAEDYIWTTDSKQEQIARAVRAEVNENIYRWRRKFASLVLRKKDIESAINALKLEQIYQLEQTQGFEYKKISRFDSESQLIDYLSQKDQQVVEKYDLDYRLTDDFYIEKMDHAIYLAER